MRKLLMPLGLFAMLLTGGCAVAPSTDLAQPSKAMSFMEAKADLQKYSGGDLTTGTSIAGNLYFDIKKVEIHGHSVVLVNEQGARRNYDINAMKQFAVSKANFDSTPGFLIVTFSDNQQLIVYTGLGPFANEAAVRLADDLMVLGKYLSPQARAQEQADFEKAAREYNESQDKPVLTEEARKFKIQAMAAVKEKRFGDAADLYYEGLSIAPWWAEGHFNRALILAETQSYGEAVDEMKRYLILVPDANNARAAQDKIYEWEGKTDSGNAAPR